MHRPTTPRIVERGRSTYARGALTPKVAVVRWKLIVSCCSVLCDGTFCSARLAGDPEIASTPDQLVILNS